mmetsp:Transcript_26597/g.38120  ORF Transcript_26597/g.38120 Transcript_26597/m.38120 type:complete len:97 (+) Transcript_26597:1014-1304(+)
MTPNVNRTAAKTSKVTQSKDVAVNASSKTASSKGEGKQMKQMSVTSRINTTLCKEGGADFINAPMNKKTTEKSQIIRTLRVAINKTQEKHQSRCSV